MVWHWLFWLSLGWLIYVYFGYPLILGLIALIAPARRSPVVDEEPTVSVLFSAKDEIDALPSKIDNLKQINYPCDKMQIIVVSDGSTDGTSEFLREQRDIEVEILENSVGKNQALNGILSKTTGEILFFTDANTFFAPDAIRNAAKLFCDKKVGCITGELHFFTGGQEDAVGEVTGLYWRYENTIKRLESVIGSVLVGAGSLLAVRKERCHTLYPDVANDFQIPMMVSGSGDLVLYSSEFLGSERAASDLKDELRRTVRIVARGICGCGRLWRTIVARPLRLWQLLSHKAMRWFTALIMLILLVSTFVLVNKSTAPFYAVMAVCQIAFYITALIGGALHIVGLRAGVLYLPFHFIALNTAALIGVIRGLIQGAPSVWDKPASARDGGSCGES